ncbi:hypothetical protein ACWD0J_27360 [Streptomyces sp. NPDC003011]
MTAAVFAVGVLGLAGCSGGDGSAAKPTDTAAGSPTASAASPLPSTTASVPAASVPVTSDAASASVPASTSPSPVPVTGPDQMLVKMTVSGGYAGVGQEVTLRGDGTLGIRGKGKPVVRRTSTAQFTELRTLLGDPALADVPAFTVDLKAADMFQYVLQFEGRTVITDRSAEQPALDRLIDALSAWLPGR